MSGNRKAALLIWIVAVLSTTVVATAMAHQTDRAEFIAEVRGESGEVEVLMQISVEDLAHHMGHIGHGVAPTEEILEAARDDIAQYLDERAGVMADDERCQLEESRYVAYPGSDGRVHYYQGWQCPSWPNEVTFVNRVMVDMHGGYRHHGVIQLGEEVLQTVFDQNYPTYSVYPEPEPESDGEAEEAEDEQAEGEAPDQVEERELVEGEGVDDDQELPQTTFWQGGWQMWLVFSALLFALAVFLAVRKFLSVQSEMSD